MEKLIKNLIQEIKKSIKANLSDSFNPIFYLVLIKLLKAYNDYLKIEHNGADYIYDIKNTNDVAECLKNGMTTEEAASLYSESLNYDQTYFLFGNNHPKPQLIKSWEELYTTIDNKLDEILLSVITCPYKFDSYKDIYRRYVANVILKENNDEINDSEIESEILSKIKQKLYYIF